MAPSGWIVQMPHRMSEPRPLRFERAVHDPAVHQHDRCRAPEMLRWPIFSRLVGVSSSLIDVAVVHDEELQGDGGVALGGSVTVAVAGEDDPAAGERARAHVVDAGLDMALALLRRAVVLDQFAAPALGVNF